MRIIIGLIVIIFLLTGSSSEAELQDPPRKIVEYQAKMTNTLSVPGILKRWKIYQDGTTMYRMLPDRMRGKSVARIKTIWKNLEFDTEFYSRGEKIFLKEVVYRDRDFEIKAIYDNEKIIKIGDKIIYDGLVRIEARRRKL